MITSIKKQYVNNLLEYMMDLENSKASGLAFDIPEEWLCHKSCKYCECNLGGEECHKQMEMDGTSTTDGHSNGVFKMIKGIFSMVKRTEE